MRFSSKLDVIFPTFYTSVKQRKITFNSKISQYKTSNSAKFLKSLLKRDLGDNCIQNFLFWRYIVGYTVGNLVLGRHVRGAVKRDFRKYTRRYTPQNINFEYGYPDSNAILTFFLKM